MSRSRKRQQRAPSGKSKKGEAQRSRYRHATMTEHEMITLKSVLSGYLSVLRNLATDEPEWGTTLASVQAVFDRLPEHVTASDRMYIFSYEERITMLEAVIAFQALLVTVFPPTALREHARADIEHLYLRLINARPLPLN